MADFEELKLTVTLVDDASAGLTGIRTQLTQLTQTAGQVQTALSGVAASAQQVGQAHQQATPHVSNQEKALKELARSAEDTTRNLVQMALASRQGIAGFTELALATRGAFTGLQGVSGAMGELGAASRVMVVGLGGVALGIGAIGAAVVAYGVSVFKFSREMYTLGQTAKSLGMTFGQLRSLTEQNERFGISVDQTVAQLGTLQSVLVDLSFSGSKMRQTLLGQGLSPKWLDEYVAKSSDAVAQMKFAQEGLQRQYEYDVNVRHLAPTVAAGNSKQLAASLGQSPDLRTQKLPRELTAEEKAALERVNVLSGQINDHWINIQEQISGIKNDFMGMGLPLVLDVVKGIDTHFKSILATVKLIASAGLHNLPIVGDVLEGAKLGKLGYDKLLGGGGAATEAPPVPQAPPATSGGVGQSLRDWYGRKTQGSAYKPTSYRGDNDNVNPLLHQASFGGSESGGGRAQAVIKAGVFEALVDFAIYMRTGSAGGGRGGVQNASFTTGNIGADSDVAASFRHGGAAVSVGPNAAGRAGIPQSDGADRYTSKATTAAPSDAGQAPSGKRGERIAAAKTAMKDQLIKDGVPEAHAEEAANLLAGQALAESGLDPTMSHDQGTGHGIYGARLGRRDAMNKWLAEKGYDRNSLEGQSRYMAHEAMTGKSYGTTRSALMNATPENRVASTNTITRNFESPRVANNRTGQVAEAAGVRSRSGTRVASIDPKQVYGNATVGVAGKFGPDVAAMTAAGAQPKNIHDYLASHGVNMSEADCGHFMAQQVKLHGGTPPQNPAVASSWNNFGQPGYSDDPNAINVAVKQGVRSGTGSHVTAAIPIRDAKGNITGFRGVGVNQGLHHVPGMGQYGRDVISSNPISIGDRPGQYHIQHQIPEVDRTALNEPLDRAALNDNNKIHSTGKLDVNVNAPPGTKVNYHGQNLLKNTSMQRQTQMMPTSVGPTVGDTAQSYMRGGT